MPELSAAGSFSSGLCFRTSPANGSKLIAGKQFKEGEKAQLLLPQWKFQELLMKKVSEQGKGEIRLGSKVTNFVERDGSVEITLEDANGKGEDIIAEYLIGADGAHSTVRKLLNIPFEGDTLDAQLVATDIIFDFKKYGYYDANFVIDPENYGLIGRINNDGLWRVSYGVSANTSEEEIQKSVDEKLKKMLPEEGKTGYEIQRIAPYKAQTTCCRDVLASTHRLMWGCRASHQSVRRLRSREWNCRCGVTLNGTHPHTHAEGFGFRCAADILGRCEKREIPRRCRQTIKDGVYEGEE